MTGVLESGAGVLLDLTMQEGLSDMSQVYDASNYDYAGNETSSWTRTLRHLSRLPCTLSTFLCRPV